MKKVKITYITPLVGKLVFASLAIKKLHTEEAKKLVDRAVIRWHFESMR